MSDEIAYRELKPGEVIQEGDEWQTESGRWESFHHSQIGQRLRVSGRRRPYNITQIQREHREASETIMIWQRATEAACRERDDKRAAIQDTHRECDALRKERDRLAIQMSELLKQKQFLTAELARIQQPPPAADHIADADKMAESELERRAWEIFVHSTHGFSGCFTQAYHWMIERDRRRQEQRENDATTAGTAGDAS